MVLESPNHCPSWPHMVLPVPHDAEGGRGCLLPLLDPSQLLSQLCPALTNIQTQLSVQTSPPDRCSWLRNQFLYCSIKQCRAAVLYFLHKLCWGPWQWIKAQREPSAFAAAWSNLCKCWMWECGPIPMISRGVTFFALWKIHCFHIFSALSCHCNHSVVPTSYLRTRRRQWERWDGCCCLTQCRGVAAGHVGVGEPETVTQVLPGAFEEVLPAMVSRKLSNFWLCHLLLMNLQSKIGCITQIGTTILRDELFVRFFCVRCWESCKKGQKLF